MHGSTPPPPSKIFKASALDKIFGQDTWVPKRNWARLRVSLYCNYMYIRRCTAFKVSGKEAFLSLFIKGMNLLLPKDNMGTMRFDWFLSQDDIKNHSICEASSEMHPRIHCFKTLSNITINKQQIKPCIFRISIGRGGGGGGGGGRGEGWHYCMCEGLLEIHLKMHYLAFKLLPFLAARRRFECS